MAIKPILFNTEMVRAILDGRKTCTRRLPNKRVENDYFSYEAWAMSVATEGCKKMTEKQFYEQYPPYKLGDILYVRETWTKECEKYYYRADYDSDYLEPCETLSGGYPASCRNHPGCEGCTATSWRIRWHPSIHMPKEAARIWLKVTDVRVERLQDMTDDDAEAEGCFDYTSTALGFPDVWDSTIKKSDIDRYGWDANPWVWVIEFERCEKPEEERR